jgi:hypothetical protein
MKAIEAAAFFVALTARLRMIKSIDRGAIVSW